MKIRVKRSVTKIGAVYTAEVEESNSTWRTDEGKTYRCPLKAVETILQEMCNYYEAAREMESVSYDS